MSLSLHDELKFISSQTSIEDTDLIERAYYKNNCNASDTIIDLLGLSLNDNEKRKRAYIRTQADDIRDILDEKEGLYKQAVDKVKVSRN